MNWGGAALTVWSAIGWLHHIFACYFDERWAMLALGVVIVPVGVINGWAMYLGIW